MVVSLKVRVKVPVFWHLQFQCIICVSQFSGICGLKGYIYSLIHGKLMTPDDVTILLDKVQLGAETVAVVHLKLTLLVH